jgi:hypothetical protein
VSAWLARFSLDIEKDQAIQSPAFRQRHSNNDAQPKGQIGALLFSRGFVLLPAIADAVNKAMFFCLSFQSGEHQSWTYPSMNAEWRFYGAHLPLQKHSVTIGLAPKIFHTQR